MRPSTFLIGGTLLFMIIVLVFVLMQREKVALRWAVYYHGSLPYSEFAEYDIVVFDSDSAPAFMREKTKGQIVLGYLSTSEAEEYRSYFDTIQSMDVLIAPSDQWAAHHVIDIRKPQWQEYFVHTLIPQVLQKGFDGIMLDTIDTALHLETIEPQRFAGMSKAAVNLVQSVRKAHPDIKIMLNRGFALLPEVANSIDYALAESIRVNYQPNQESPQFFPNAVYDEISTTLKAATRINPRLKIMTLDYIPIQKSTIPLVKRVYSQHRSNGFYPYVTTYDLGSHHREPE
ncbi:MAG: endo alpha-1,4 polygalactosaminidase [Alphaproteobacteria bacterium]|nr:endo alpha-1,4 polygalactosaminidase [Alphaproteobacteria bacterium]